MPFVGPYQPLVQKPTQQALNQSYGGGSFFQPPVTQNTLKPNATGLINPTGNRPNGNAQNTPNPTQSQITNSPLAKRNKTRGGDGDAGGASGAEKADYGPSVQTGKGNQYALAAIGLAPGLGIATGFTRIMQELGFTGVVGGGSPRFNNAAQKEQFNAVIAAGREADREYPTPDIESTGAGATSGVSDAGADSNYGDAPPVDSGYTNNDDHDANDTFGGDAGVDSSYGDSPGPSAPDKEDHDNDGDSSTGSSGDGGTGWT